MAPYAPEDQTRLIEALHESELRFRAVVEGSMTGISIVQNNAVVYQNPEMERLLGPLPRSVMLTEAERIHPDDRARVEAFYQNVRPGAPAAYEIDFRFYPPGPTVNGGGFKWVNCRTSAIRYRGGDALLVNMMDITRTREMEHLLRMQDRMTGLGRVAAGIAHEIRNPLSGINIYLDTLEKRLSGAVADARVTKILAQLRSASNKIESVIRRVIDFSRPSRPRCVPMDVNVPIREALNLCQVTLRKSGIRLEAELADEPPPCRLDPHLIEEVMLNLVTNAADALKCAAGEKRVRIVSTFNQGRIRVTVADTGPGIAPLGRQTIFDPFYTTKEGSTGIGLSLSRRIITDHGGTLEAENDEVLGGARFVITLPLHPGDGTS